MILHSTPVHPVRRLETWVIDMVAQPNRDESCSDRLAALDAAGIDLQLLSPRDTQRRAQARSWCAAHPHRFRLGPRDTPVKRTPVSEPPPLHDLWPPVGHAAYVSTYGMSAKDIADHCRTRSADELVLGSGMGFAHATTDPLFAITTAPGLTEADWCAIAGGTAARLLGL